MPAKRASAAAGDLVPDAQFRQEVGDPSKMTVWRRDHGNKTPPNWPARIEINKRFFRARSDIERYKSSLLSEASAQFVERVEKRRRRGYRVTVPPTETRTKEKAEQRRSRDE
jgi:hypothetical protein